MSKKHRRSGRTTADGDGVDQLPDQPYSESATGRPGMRRSPPPVVENFDVRVEVAYPEAQLDGVSVAGLRVGVIDGIAGRLAGGQDDIVGRVR